MEAMLPLRQEGDVDHVEGLDGGGLVAGEEQAAGQRTARPAALVGYWGCARINHWGWT